MIIRTQEDVTAGGARRDRAGPRSALPRGDVGPGAPSPRLRARGEAHRGGVPSRLRDHRRARAAHHGKPQRGCADVGLARRLDPRLPSQQRRQGRDRNHSEPARPVLAAQFAADRKRRLDRALADAGRADLRHCLIKDQDGKPVAGAEVDVWHSSTEGYYENQDPAQADMNLRGKFTSDADGHIASAASSRPAIRSRSTGRWATSCAPSAAPTCARPISIS